MFTIIEDHDPNSNYWLLGDPFLRAFYSIYDMENLKVGLTGEIYDHGAPPKDETEDGGALSGNKMFILIAAAGAVLLVAIFVICCCCCCKNKSSTPTSKVSSFQSERPHS